MCKVMEDMRNESWREGVQEGKKEGIKEGIKESMKVVASRMLEAGKYALEEIAEISGLSLEDVKKLQAGQGA